MQLLEKVEMTGQARKLPSLDHNVEDSRTR